MDSSVRFDAQRDLAALARVARVPLVLVARADLPLRTAAQLIEFARSNPGKLTYASGGASARMAIESLRATEGLDIVVVPYKGTAPALLDVVAGRVDLVLADVAAAAPHVRSGALHLIGNAGSLRSRAFPEAPTMAEQGVSDFVWESWQGIVAPAATPGEIISLLKNALSKVRASAGFREGLERLGFESIDESPEAFSAILRDETERFRKLVSSLPTDVK
jgi:tripartite-type tricarboxylate transporter receptor subunit TctC